MNRNLTAAALILSLCFAAGSTSLASPTVDRAPQITSQLNGEAGKPVYHNPPDDLNLTPDTAQQSALPQLGGDSGKPVFHNPPGD